MEIQGYFTAKGLALSAKLLSGATLHVTRVAAGSGNTAKPASAAVLPQIRQTLAVNTPSHRGNTAVIPATLVAAQAAADYTLTELGVYAKDPDLGEILYKVYKLSEPVDIAAGSSMVLRFYLEESVSQDLDMVVTVSPAGLITEEDFFPVRDRVMAAEAVVKPYTMDIGELQVFLDDLPRLLTEDLRLYVSGTLTETLSIKGFYGCGSITIIGPDSASGDVCVLQNRAEVDACLVPVELSNIAFDEPEDAASNQSLLLAHKGGYVSVHGCTFTGLGASSIIRGVSAYQGTLLTCDSVAISGCATAVFSSSGGSVHISGPAEGFHDNTVGAYAWKGGTVYLYDQVPELLGGNTNSKKSGLIIKQTGTLL